MEPAALFIFRKLFATHTAYFIQRKNEYPYQTWIVLLHFIPFQDMKFRSAIMNDLKMVVTKYRQRPPDQQDAGETDPLERWNFIFLYVP